MNQDMIKEKLIVIFKEYTRVPDKALSDDSPLNQWVDSLTLIEVAFQIEEAFEIEIPDEEVKKIKCFTDIVEAINRQLK